jgi:hypothetical protein
MARSSPSLRLAGTPPMDNSSLHPSNPLAHPKWARPYMKQFNHSIKKMLGCEPYEYEFRYHYSVAVRTLAYLWKRSYYPDVSWANDINFGSLRRVKKVGP